MVRYGDTGTAQWHDDTDGGPSDESVRQGLVIQSEELGEFVWIPVKDINEVIKCQSNEGGASCQIQMHDDHLICTAHQNTEMARKVDVSHDQRYICTRHE